MPPTQKSEKAAHAAPPDPHNAVCHAFLVPFRSKSDGARYAYTYNVYEYDSVTTEPGNLLCTSTDPEFDTCRILASVGKTGELYFWKTTKNWAIKIKDIVHSATLRTADNNMSSSRFIKKEIATDEQKESLRALSKKNTLGDSQSHVTQTNN